MPSVSQKQHNAMEAAAHGHSNLGIPQSVGKEFENADTGKTFKDGDEPPAIEDDPMMQKLDRIFDLAQIASYRLGRVEERRAISGDDFKVFHQPAK